MDKPSDNNWEKLREQIIGLGEFSARKSYYPELQRRIRELEEMRQHLNDANRQMQEVLDAASEISVIATDRAGVITVFNRGAEKMLGYAAEEMVGKQTPLILHLDSEIAGRARVISEEFGRPVSGFRVFVENSRRFGLDQHEWTYVRKDGGTLLVNLMVTTIHDDHGVISGYLGIAKDITHQKAMEDQIVENDKLLHAIIDSIPNPIFYKDVRGVYIGCNAAFCAYVGVKRERIIGATVFDIAPSEFADRYHQADQDLMSQLGTQTYESRVRYADGSYHDVIFYKSCLLDAGGKLRGLVGVMLDITERKRVERELSRKEELFHLLFEKSGDANLLIHDSVFIDCNDATVRMLGFVDKKQVISCHPADLSPVYQPDGRLSSEKANDMIDLAYQQGSHRFEWLHLKADGSELPVEVMLTAIPMNDQWIIHTAWRDLSERKKAEAENEKLAQNLLHAQKIESIGRLAGGVAHDFNNLLTPIIGYAEMLRNFCSGDERASQRLNAILDAAGKARDLTRQLLAFGRKQVLEMKPVNLAQLIEAFMLILERTIRENVTIRLNLDPATGLIMADTSQIEQIVMNLAINAQDAMPEGGLLVIETDNCFLGDYTHADPDIVQGEYVRLSVSDNGSGIDRTVINHIFEPFYTTKEQGRGTGLGLATVFGIVKQHGGQINVYSELGHGSTFTIYFPVLTETAEPAELPPDDAEFAGVTDGVAVLLVEDNFMVRDMTAELLTNLGYEVIVADAPDTALEAVGARSGKIDLLLSDVIMPGMNGPALYEKLKPLCPGMKVLFMSGYSENIISHQDISANPLNYIQKPFTSKTLLAKIQQVLQN